MLEIKNAGKAHTRLNRILRNGEVVTLSPGASVTFHENEMDSDFLSVTKLFGGDIVVTKVNEDGTVMTKNAAQELARAEAEAAAEEAARQELEAQAAEEAARVAAELAEKERLEAEESARVAKEAEDKADTEESKG